MTPEEYGKLVMRVTSQSGQHHPGDSGDKDEAYGVREVPPQDHGTLKYARRVEHVRH
jgi:hypothetical protein